MAFLLFMLLSMHSVVQHAYETSVVIVADYLGSDGTMQYGQNICSGFIVSSDKAVETIATARHCMEKMDDKAVLFYDGDHGRIEGVSPSDSADVGLIYVHSMRSHPVVSFSRTVIPGDRYFLVGMGSGDVYSFASLVSRNGSMVFDVDTEGPEMLFEAPSAYEGDSGAAVFDMRGHVVGVLDAGEDPTRPNVVYVAPSYCVQEML